MLGSNTATAITRTISKNVLCECSQAQVNGSGGPPPSSTLGSNPVCATGALWTQPGAGKLAVLGSAEMFDDAWLDREDNARVMDWVFRWLRRVRATSFLYCVAQYKRCKEREGICCVLPCVTLCNPAHQPQGRIAAPCRSALRSMLAIAAPALALCGSTQSPRLLLYLQRCPVLQHLGLGSSMPLLAPLQSALCICRVTASACLRNASQ